VSASGIIRSVVPTLETERLILLPLELADAAQLQVLFPHWDVVKHLNNIAPWPYPADGSGLARAEKEMKDGAISLAILFSLSHMQPA
jgi:hypothetical protein